jgi:outer membrane protein assembly factor BamE (lipoprotein component of BamABCDE complex)
MKFSLGRRPIARAAVASISIVLLVAGCSIYREANRPKPVVLSKFEPGQTRHSVVERLDQPIVTDPQSNKGNDILDSVVTRC